MSCFCLPLILPLFLLLFFTPAYILCHLLYFFLFIFPPSDFPSFAFITFRLSPWCHSNFSLTQSFRSHYGPGVDSASNRNGYQGYLLRGKGGRCLGLTTLSPSSADYLEIWEPQPPGTLRTCPGIPLPLYGGFTVKKKKRRGVP